MLLSMSEKDKLFKTIRYILIFLAVFLPLYLVISTILMNRDIDRFERETQEKFTKFENEFDQKTLNYSKVYYPEN